MNHQQNTQRRDDDAVMSAVDWLDSLPAWDGTSRVNTFLADCFGVCESPEIVKHVGQFFATTAVAQPRQIGLGYQYYIPALITGGCDVSEALAALMPEPSLFWSTDAKRKTRTNAKQAHGRWLIELTNVNDMRGLKSFTEYDPDEFKRCVFIRTARVLKPSFQWVRLNCDPEFRADPEAVAEIRDQFWAEAAALTEAHGVMWREVDRLMRVRYSRGDLS